MSAKRQATYDLNHDNWDRDEEPEERGTFRTASDEELKNRVIKKAKRKIVSDTGNDAIDGGSGKKSVFSGFSGFGKPAAELTSSSPFSFLSKIPAVAAATSGVVSSSTAATSVAPTFSFGSGSDTTATTAKNTEISKAPFSSGSSVVTAPPETSKTSTISSKSSVCTEYHKKLSVLNQAVCEWIKTHVEKNPVCILSPIFKDYEKYLKEIENEKQNVESKAINSGAREGGEKQSSATNTGFKFSSSSNAISTKSSEASSTTSDAATKANGFTFGLKKVENAPPVKTSTTQGFSFAINPSAALSTTSTSITTNSSFSFSNASINNNQSSTPPKAFSFNPGATPFSFGNIKPPDVSAPTTSGEDPNEEENEEPPKNEFKQVVEDGAVYSKKCKVFVKKDGNFVDKGVGTLYLKPVESSGKTQMLVRADTNLGNILVNLILNSAIPTERKGKNNVMMVCLPTPEVEKPTLMLLRVKTGEEADELLENIKNHKK